MRPQLGNDIRLRLPLEAALTRTRDTLKQEGFGVLTEIDLEAAFKEKLGKPFHPYRILGACNPPLAYSAVSADPSIGLLLPCNVTVEAPTDGAVIVRLTDPEALLGADGAASSMADVARDARARLLRVHAALSRSA
ncbi:MAG TPA: DUF302 domain-containing protein [Gemmatimonadales bacterium]|nr:DUF302 domain-containing protein [Gemmatimonadales bacterium]